MLLGLLTLGKLALSGLSAVRRNRRRKSLGDAPIEHAGRFSVHAKKSLEFSQLAKSYANEGLCDKALRFYGGAEETAGAAAQEAVSLRHGDNTEALKRLQRGTDEAETAVRACYVRRAKR